MILETLISGLGGAVLRLAPDVINAIQRKDERKHELEMARLGQTGKSEEAKSALALAAENNASVEEQARLSALSEGIKTQGQATGIKWIDGMSASVRPVLVYLGTVAWMAELFGMIPPIVGENKALISGMFGFYFMHRTMRNK